MRASGWRPSSLAVVLLLAAGCGTVPSDGTGFAERHGSTAQPRRYLAIEGMQPSQTLAQFLQGADTVIRGTVTQVQTVRLGEKVSETLKGGAYEQISVRVDEVMSGIAPDSVQVRRLMSTEELEVDVDSYRRPVEVGATYVMALFRGSGMWAGSYLFQGPQAAAPVVKGVVRFPTGAIPMPAGDNNLSLPKLRSLLN